MENCNNYKLILFSVAPYFFYLLSLIKHDKMGRICNFLCKRIRSEINDIMFISTNIFTFGLIDQKDNGRHTRGKNTKHSSYQELTSWNFVRVIKHWRNMNKVKRLCKFVIISKLNRNNLYHDFSCYVYSLIERPMKITIYSPWYWITISKGDRLIINCRVEYCLMCFP